MCELREQGLAVGVDTLRNILFEQLGLSRRAAYKDEAAGRSSKREEQFQHIARLRAGYEREGWFPTECTTCSGTRG